VTLDVPYKDKELSKIMKTAKDYFNASAGKWDEKPQRITMANAVAGTIIREIKPSIEMDAMEFGCGTGLISMAVAPMLKSVLAVDMSENMLAVLKEKITEDNVENIFPRHLDFTKDELPEERFDLIFSSMALHHVKDAEGLLATFFQLLNPGGRVALADLDAEDGGFHGEIPDVFHLGFDRGELGRLLEKAGFADISATTAHVMKKESSTTGQTEEFPVFLMTAKKDTIP
jgi:2-polyprenyl-3-methyl-5-hydroxy-6-metoxy-1,4-benzoquinol methylase